MNETFQLTDPECVFIDHFCYETTYAHQGPAVRWLNEHEIRFYEMVPLERVRARQDPDFILHLIDGPPGEFVPAWDSAAAMRDRARQAALSLPVEV